MRPITLSERGVAQPRVSPAELLSGSRPALDGACTLPLADYAHEIRYAATPGYADKPARGTAIPYRDVLASLWLLDPVHAWMPTESLMTRLGQTPKHYLAEPALVGLLGLTRDALLDGVGTPIGPQAGTMLGHLFESVVTLCVRVPAQAAETGVAHIRTRNGDHEVDPVLIRDDGRVLAIDMKLANIAEDKDVRHLSASCPTRAQCSRITGSSTVAVDDASRSVAAHEAFLARGETDGAFAEPGRDHPLGPASIAARCTRCAALDPVVAPRAGTSPVVRERYEELERVAPRARRCGVSRVGGRF